MKILLISGSGRYFWKRVWVGGGRTGNDAVLSHQNILRTYATFTVVSVWLVLFTVFVCVCMFKIFAID